MRNRYEGALKLANRKQAELRKSEEKRKELKKELKDSRDANIKLIAEHSDLEDERDDFKAKYLKYKVNEVMLL